MASSIPPSPRSRKQHQQHLKFGCPLELPVIPPLTLPLISILTLALWTAIRAAMRAVIRAALFSALLAAVRFCFRGRLLRLSLAWLRRRARRAVEGNACLLMAFLLWGSQLPGWQPPAAAQQDPEVAEPESRLAEPPFASPILNRSGNDPSPPLADSPVPHSTLNSELTTAPEVRLTLPKFFNHGRDLVFTVGHAPSNATYELLFSQDLGAAPPGNAGSWTVLQRGLAGQTNFVVRTPNASSGFFMLRVPRLTGPAALRASEDTPLSLNPFSIAGATNASARLIVSATNGLLFLSPTNGPLPPGNAGSSMLAIEGSPELITSSLHRLWYQGRKDYFGPDLLSLLLTNGPASTAPELLEVLVAIQPVNDAPSAAPDAYQVSEDSTLFVPAPGVLANDTDVEHDPLSAVLAVSPLHGTLSLNGDGSFSYLPDPGFFGNDRFLYVASDGDRLSRAATVGITVVPENDPPAVQISNPTSGAALAIGAQIGLQALAIDSDGAVVAVEYFDGNQPLGSASSPPFTVPWRPASPGSHWLQARATDDSGAVSLSRPIAVTVGPDCDGDGISDAVELSSGSDPCDFFNGLRPRLTLVSGGFQSGSPNSVLPEPVVVRVSNSSGTSRTNLPVRFSVQSGEGLVASTNSGPWSNSITVLTGPTGLASAWFRLPGSTDQLSLGKASTGSGPALAEVSFAETAVAARDRWVIDRQPVSVSAGGHHTLVLLNDGTVRAWGWNAMGQLGDGIDRSTTPFSPIPLPVPGLSNVISVAAGAWHSLALLNDGTVRAWGEYWEGYPAVAPADLSNVRAIAAGHGHSLALLVDGTVRAWGDPFENMLPPAGATGLTAIAAGSGFSLALRTNGTVLAWGLSAFDPDHGQTRVPPGLNSVKAIAAGTYHALALRSNGTVVAWGLNANGQAAVPASLANVVAISAGLSHSTALLADGTVTRWGQDDSNGAGPVAGMEHALALDAGGVGQAAHSVLIRSDGSVWSWGANSYGQLGNGSVTSSPSPTQALGLPPPGITTTEVGFEVYTPLK